MTARSYLFVPGDRADMLEKSLLRGADAVIYDLEDAVAPDRKAVARATVSQWLDAAPSAACELWVRVNADTVAEDIDAVLRPGVAGIVLAKATQRLLSDADDALTEAERRLGLAAEAVAVMPLIESAVAMLDVRTIAASARVQRLAAGEADLISELGMARDVEEALVALRVQLVVASAAAGIGPPVGPVETDFRDVERLRTTTVQLARMGFRARPAIHPAQVSVINAVLTPTHEEVRRAVALLERFEAAGGGATTDEDGRLIDQAVARGARDILDRATASSRANGYTGDVR